jgi:hypothetical protein
MARASKRPSHPIVDRLNESLTVANLAKALGACGIIAGSIMGVISYFVTHKEFNVTTAWVKYDIRNNRLEYLNDKQYECDQKKIVGQLITLDQVLCAHYESQHTQVGAEVADLKAKAGEASK